MSLKILNYLIILFLFISFSSCDSKYSDGKKVLSTNVADIDTVSGYEINPFNNRKTNPILDSSGNIFPTGKTIVVQAKLIGNKIQKPQKFELKSSKKLKVVSNTIENVIPDVIMQIDISELTRFNLVNDKCTLEIADGKNRPLKINEDFDVKAEITSFSNHQSKPIKNSRYPDIVDYDLKLLSSKQGLSSDYIRVIFQDSKGKIWIANDALGVDLYNGENIKILNDKSGFPLERIYDIKEDQNGNIWFAGYDNGIVKFDGQKFYHWKSENGLPKGMITEICIAKNGEVFFACFGGGLLRFSDNKFKIMIPSNEPYSKYTYSLDQDKEGKIWIGSGYGGLYSFDNNEFTYYSGERGLEDMRIYSIKSHVNNGIWFSSNLGLARIENDSFYRFEEVPEFSPQTAHRIFTDSKGLIWFNIGNKAYSFNGAEYQIFDLKDGIIEGEALCISPSIEGEVWFGTYGAGIKRINPAGFTHLNKDRNFSENITISMTMDKQGLKWFGTNTGELIQQNENSYTYYERPEFMQGNLIGKICADNEKGIWYTSWKNSLVYQQGNMMEVYDPGSGFGTLELYGLFSDSKKRLWLGNKYDGLSFYHQGKIYRLSNKEGLPTDNINLITEDENGNIWVATNGGGLLKYTEGKLKVFSEKEGLNSNFITALHISGQDIWIGHASEGINLMKGDKIYSFKEDHGLISDVIWSITSDPKFGTWVGTEKGLSLILKSQKTALENSLIINYDHNDGLKANDFIGNCLINDQEKNTIYWGTGKSMINLDLDQFELNKKKPEIVISDFLVNKKFIDFTLDSDSAKSAVDYNKVSHLEDIPKTISLSHDKNNITLIFASKIFTSKQRVFYQHKLSGLGSGWSKRTTSNTVEYQNLDPGEYKFQLKAFNEAGISSEPLEIIFNIKPAFWESVWAKAFYVFIIALILYFIYRFQLKMKLEKAEALRLKELDSFKSTFFANISHEFRTPLTIIKGIPDFLRTDFKNGDKANFDRHIDAVRRNGDNLLNLVDQILELSKLETKKTDLTSEVFDLNQIVKSYLTAYDSLISTKNIEVKLNMKLLIAPVNGEKKALSYIIQNLISNAIKYTQDGFISIDVFEHSKDMICFQITDTGKGIPQDKIGKIFNRYYQVQDSDNFEEGGFGLGLAIAKEFVDLLNGKIDVESQLNKGTAFRVYLPKSENYQNVKNFKESEIISRDFGNEISLEAEQESDRPHILIVEDNKDMQEYLVELLKEEYELSLAANGKIGFEKAKSEVPDFIITDWMMPELNGPDMISLIKKDMVCSHIPVMLLTARADQESKITGYEQGAEAYLSKPFNEHELKAQVSNLISAGEKLREFIGSSSEEKSLIKVFDSEKEFIEKSKALVESNIKNSDLDGDWLASAFALSRSQFARKLRAISGLSVTQFIRNIRLEKAKILLKEKRLNISEVAFEIGISDPSYFTRIFSKEVGISPTNYK